MVVVARLSKIQVITLVNCKISYLGSLPVTSRYIHELRPYDESQSWLDDECVPLQK
jgi:hypothetical protein